jgi:hypothetical protein
VTIGIGIEGQRIGYHTDELTFTDSEGTYRLGQLCGTVGPLGLETESLAAAINVTPATLEGWVKGKQLVPDTIAVQLQRGLDANQVEYVILGKAWAGENIVVPKHRWTPVFRPQSKFRLPLSVEWSGTAETRWRNAQDPHSLDVAYTLLLDEGGVSDIVRWVDPYRLVNRLRPVPTGMAKLPLLPEVLLDQYRRELWPEHLSRLGYANSDSFRSLYSGLLRCP